MRKFTSIFVISTLLIAASTCAAKIPADVKAILNKIEAAQDKIKDMQAEIESTATAKMTIRGEETTQKFAQKGKIWIKKPDKFRIETSSPVEQITIMNGDKMAIINKTTGQKIVQDMKKLREQTGMTQGEEMNIVKTMEQFDLKITKKDKNEIVITGKPEKKSEYLGKMVFVIDANKHLPIRIASYSPKGGLLTYSTLEYKEISKIWVLVKNTTDINTPYGSSKTVMEFKNIKVNKGISDKLFEIE